MDGKKKVNEQMNVDKKEFIEVGRKLFEERMRRKAKEVANNKNVITKPINGTTENRLRKSKAIFTNAETNGNESFDKGAYQAVPLRTKESFFVLEPHHPQSSEALLNIDNMKNGKESGNSYNLSKDTNNNVSELVRLHDKERTTREMKIFVSNGVFDGKSETQAYFSQEGKGELESLQSPNHEGNRESSRTLLLSPIKQQQTPLPIEQTDPNNITPKLVEKNFDIKKVENSEHFQEELSKAKQEIARERDILKNQLAESHKELQKLRAKLELIRQKELQEEKELKESTSREMMDLVERLKSEVTRLQQQLDTKSESVKSLSNKNDQLEKKLAAQMETISTLMTEKTQLVNEMQKRMERIQQSTNSEFNLDNNNNNNSDNNHHHHHNNNNDNHIENGVHPWESLQAISMQKTQLMQRLAKETERNQILVTENERLSQKLLKATSATMSTNLHSISNSPSNSKSKCTIISNDLPTRTEPHLPLAMTNLSNDTLKATREESTNIPDRLTDWWSVIPILGQFRTKPLRKKAEIV